MSSYIIFPVGDWSANGHGFCSEFIIQSDKDLATVKKTHFSYNDFFGAICEDHLDNLIHHQHLVEGCLLKPNSQLETTQQFLSDIFNQHHFKTYNHKPLTIVVDNNYGEGDDLFNMITEEQHDWVMSSSTDLVNLWVSLLNWFNPELNLQVVSHAISDDYLRQFGYPYSIDGYMNTLDIENSTEFNTIHSDEPVLQLPGYGIWKYGEDLSFYRGEALKKHASRPSHQF